MTRDYYADYILTHAAPNAIDAYHLAHCDHWLASVRAEAASEDRTPTLRYRLTQTAGVHGRPELEAVR